MTCQWGSVHDTRFHPIDWGFVPGAHQPTPAPRDEWVDVGQGHQEGSREQGPLEVRQEGPDDHLELREQVQVPQEDLRDESREQHAEVEGTSFEQQLQRGSQGSRGSQEQVPNFQEAVCFCGADRAARGACGRGWAQVPQEDLRDESREQHSEVAGTSFKQQLQQGSQGSRGSQEDLKFDVNMLKEDLRDVMLKIRTHIVKSPSGMEALALPTDCFCQSSVVTASRRTDLDPTQHLSWMLLGFNINMKQDKYEGEPVAWIDPAEMRTEERMTCQCLLDSLKDFLGGRRGRALPPALVRLGRVGIVFLELAVKGQCAIGPLIGHHIMIHGQFKVDDSCTFGIVPDYKSIEQKNRPLYDGIKGLDAILTELQAKSLGFRDLLHSNYSTNS